MDTTIICLGNRLVPQDSAGPAVYDWLQQKRIPENVEVIEGGTAGLNLLSLLEQKGRVIFVDSVSGCSDAEEIIVFEAEDIANTDTQPLYGHEIGLAYVLSVLPQVNEGKLPQEISVVGIKGRYNAKLIQKAADLCLAIAVNTT